MSWESIATSLMPSPYEDKKKYDEWAGTIPNVPKEQGSQTGTKTNAKPKDKPSLGVKTYLFIGLAFATITITVILLKKHGRTQ